MPSLGSNEPYSLVLGIHFTTRVRPMMVRREHNNGVPKFRVDTDRETENTTTLSPAKKEWLWYHKGNELGCPLCTSVKSSNECYYFKDASIFKMQSHAHAEDLASNKGWESFQKEKGKTTFCHIFYTLVMILYTLPCLLWHNLLQRQDFRFYNSSPTFWGKKWNLLFTVTIHLSLFTVTIHSEFLPI